MSDLAAGTILFAASIVLLFIALIVGGTIPPASVTTWLFSAPDNLVTLIGSGLVFAGLLATARQWQRDNVSKREEARSRQHAEYADRLRAFRTWRTNSAIKMILNYDRDIELYEGQPEERVCWEYCELALIPAIYRRYLYEPTLIAIRDRFNDLIENISQLVFLEREKLIRQEDVDHICRTMLVRIAAETQFGAAASAPGISVDDNTATKRRSGVESLPAGTELKFP